MKYLDKLLQVKKTVFTKQDLSLILWIINENTLRNFIVRMIQSNLFQNPYPWIYTFPHYDLFEFSSKIKKNSYISFETVLREAGVIFQEYGNTLFLATDNSLEKTAVWYTFKCLKIKDDILYNPLGLIKKNGYSIASIERAICDRLYLSKNYYFDNLSEINKEKLWEIAQIYNKRVILEIKKILNA